MFDRPGYEDFIIYQRCIGFFESPLILKSGRESDWYANMRGLTNTVSLTDTTVGYVEDFLREEGIEYDYVIGVPDGATKLGLFLSYKLGGKLVMGRKGIKFHGASRDRLFVGPAEEGDRVCVLEDVTTTGGSLIEFIEQLKSSGLYVASAIALVNRLERVADEDPRGVEDVLQEKGTPYHALTDATTVLPRAYEKLRPGKEIARKIEDYFDKYGTVEMNLL